jgi:hypothetical protein
MREVRRRARGLARRILPGSWAGEKIDEIYCIPERFFRQFCAFLRANFEQF